MEIHKDLNYYLNIFWIAVYFILQINYSRGCQAKPKIDIGSSRRHFEDNHDDGEIVDPEVPMENVAMATKMEDVGTFKKFGNTSERHHWQFPRYHGIDAPTKKFCSLTIVGHRLTNMQPNFLMLWWPSGKWRSQYSWPSTSSFKTNAKMEDVGTF